MKTVTIIGLLTLAFIAIAGMLKTANSTEIQKYETLYTNGDFEIRFYPTAIMASVSMDGGFDNSRNSGFRVLAGYIFGGNEENQKIAMTAPVRMSNDQGTNTMSFVLPSKMEFNNLPKPNDGDIVLHQSRPVYAAVVRYGGYTNSKEIEAKKKELIGELQNLGLAYKTNFEFLGYNAPYDMFNRRNEVWVELYNFDPALLENLSAK